MERVFTEICKARLGGVRECTIGEYRAKREYTVFHISLPEQASALIFLPNVCTVNRGVHGHRPIVFLSPYIPMIDRGALPRLTLNDAIYMRHTCVVYRLSAYACTCINLRVRGRSHFCWGFAPKLRMKNEWNKLKNHFYEMNGDVGMSRHEKEMEQEDAYTKTQTHS